jgi:8-oxo-dGTP pyrophosphatase MutT (NUDIX family)
MTGFRFDEAEFRSRAARLLLHAPPLDLQRGDDDLNPDARAIPHDRAPRPAAVLVPVIRRAPELTVLLTERTAHLRSHAGQVAFPGGAIDDGEGPVAAALREAEEEIALDPAHVEPLGFLDGYLTRTAYAVTPVIGLVDTEAAFTPHEAEVARLFEVPLRFLMNEANHEKHSREWQGKPRHFHAMRFGDHYIWGATAGMIRNLFERMYQ